MPQMNERLVAALADKYRIEKELGAGGMATVYLATDLKHGRQVALKVLRPELTPILGAERFLSEIRITARLDHPHLLTLIDSGRAEEFLYYVLPYVRGESLRQLLDREGPLGLSEAFVLLRQVAAALEYAHQEGVIHRDIKPENILIQENQAMLGDFGIALGLSGAEERRLTGTGMALGTPQYMSPEQAAGEARLDARSDVYSLAAVFYEMLAGEPAIQGTTAQAIVARLLTETPTPLRVLRNTVPVGVSAAVSRGLAKTPADRFTTVADFMSAAEAGLAGDHLPRSRAGRMRVILAVSAVVLLGFAILAIVRRSSAHPGRLALGSRTQLTSSAEVLLPAISADGKQLAYFTKHCAGGECVLALEVQDVGDARPRTILDSATAAYWIEWSPDRRHLLVNATIGKRWGTYLVSALGAPPRFVGVGVATFLAGGDSLLAAPPLGRDSITWLRTTTLSGDQVDSLRLTDAGSGVGRVLAVPGSKWIIVETRHGQSGRWDLLDRKGRVVDHLTSTFNILAGQEADDALWLNSAGGSIIRVPIDVAGSRFSKQWDTIPGPIENFSVTADGRNLVIDQGTYDYGVWRITLADVLAGRLADSLRIAHASEPVQVEISPDGGHLRWIREQAATAGGSSEQRIVVTPYASGSETPINVAGTLIGAYWKDSMTLSVGTRPSPHRVHLALVNARNGAETAAMDLPPDSDVVDFTPVEGGWSWIPTSDDRIVVRQGDRRRSFLKPDSLWNLGQMQSDERGRLISYLGWTSTLQDSVEVGVAVGVISLETGTNTRWTNIMGENAGTTFLPDGSILLLVFDTQQTASLYRLRGPGRRELLGTIPRPVFDLSVAGNLHQAVVTIRDYRADAWMMRLVRQ